MDAATAESQPVRSRPRNRRAEIARNAGELFSVRGFHAVRMDDIADASGITARALYRHYTNKQALLAHVVREDQARVVETLTALSERDPAERSPDADLTTLIAAALDSRRLSLLWQREARHLDVEDYRLVRGRTRWIARTISELFVVPAAPDLDGAAADLRSWVVVSIISGHGLYDSPLPRPRLAEELSDAVRRVVSRPAGTAVDEPAAETGRTSISRREQLVYAAAGEFREKGFGGVSIDDIGGRVGVVGPALYRYFDTKADILVAAVNRLHEWRALELTRAMRSPCPDEEVLDQLVRGYIRVSLEATDLLAVWLTERLYLPDPVRERFDRVQADHVAEWARWLSAARPHLSDAHAMTLVRTAMTLIDDCVRIPHLQRYAGLPTELSRATLATLGR